MSPEEAACPTPWPPRWRAGRGRSCGSPWRACEAPGSARHALPAAAAPRSAPRTADDLDAHRTGRYSSAYPRRLCVTTPDADDGDTCPCPRHPPDPPEDHYPSKLEPGTRRARGSRRGRRPHQRLRLHGGSALATAFRGYDKDAVDAFVADPTERLRTESERVPRAWRRRARRPGSRRGVRLARPPSPAKAASSDNVQRLEEELAAATARAGAEQQVQALSEERLGADIESANRNRFEEVLGGRGGPGEPSLHQERHRAGRPAPRGRARAEIQARRRDAQVEAEAILLAGAARGSRSATQDRHRGDGARSAAESARPRTPQEKVSRAEQEAATIRARRSAAPRRRASLVTRETTDMRAEAEEAVASSASAPWSSRSRRPAARTTRKQEFLVLHNQAVAHAERITQDANEQVAAPPLTTRARPRPRPTTSTASCAPRRSRSRRTRTSAPVSTSSART